MEIQLSEIGAAVSLLFLEALPTHNVYSLVAEARYKLLSSEQPGHYTHDNAFDVPPPRDEFWRLLRANGCDQIVYCFMTVLKSLTADRGFSVVHNGQRLENVYATNSHAMDVSDLVAQGKEPTVVCGDGPGQQTIPMFSTYSNMKVQRRRPQLARNVGFSPPESSDDFNETLDVVFSRANFVTGLKLDETDLVPHWWVTVETVDKMYHVDLCGPAYGIFDYQENVMHTGLSAPVHIFESELFCIREHVGNRETLAHKLLMSSSVCPGLSRNPPDNRYFRHTKSGLPNAVTPLQAFLDRIDATHSAGGVKAFVDGVAERIGDYFIGVACVGTGIKSRNLQRADLNLKVGRIVEQNQENDRVGVMLQGRKEPVSVLRSKLTVFPPSTPPYRSLADMKAYSALIDDLAFIPGDSVTIWGLTNAAHLNGQNGTVIKLAARKDAFEECRWLVEIGDDRKSIAAKNLKRRIVKSHSTTNTIADVKDTMKYLNTDQVGTQLWARVLAGDMTFTTVMDPVFRVAVRRIVNDKLWLALSDERTQEKWEKMLAIAERPKGEVLRQLILQMRKGIDPATFQNVMQDAELKSLYDEMVNSGMLAMRK